MRLEGRILSSKHLQDSFLLPRRRPLEHGKVPFALAQHTTGGALALSQTRRYSNTHISGGEIFQATGESGGDFEIRRPSDQSIEMRTSESLTRWVVRTNHIQHKHQSSITNREEQIIETRDKPQCLAVQRLLSHLQYPDYTKSSTKDLSLLPSKFKISWQ